MPKIGATPFGYRIAEQFGLAVVPPRPALVPLAFAPDALARFGDLSGVSVDAEVTCNGGRFRENLLFTHRGLSGPAILQISSYWDGRDADCDRPAARRSMRKRGCARARDTDASLPKLLAERLPQAIRAAVVRGARGCAAGARRSADRGLRNVAAGLHRWQVLPSGTLGYNKAEVTLGGVDTRGLSSRTMAASAVPGLYFIGEVGRRHRLARRLQLPVGVGVGTRGRAIRLPSSLGLRADASITFILLVLRRSFGLRCASPGSNPGVPVLYRFALVMSLVALSSLAHAQVKIGLMVSATGPTTAIGIPQKNTGDLLPRKIGDATVEYIQLDDGGDTTRAVQNIKKLIQENNIDAMIGPSTTPNALAILDVIADAKVPVMATVGTSSVVEPLDAKKRWVFKTTQNDDLIAGALIKHMTEERREDRRLHRLQRSVWRELVQGVLGPGREGGHSRSSPASATRAPTRA